MGKFRFKPTKDIDDAGQTNAVRAARAEQAIREGFKICRADELQSYNAADLFSDIFHLCDRNSWDVDEMIEMAKDNWQEER
jgi:hypothetical protein